MRKLITFTASVTVPLLTDASSMFNLTTEESDKLVEKFFNLNTVEDWEVTDIQDIDEG